jgi:hypothetical protein
VSIIGAADVAGMEGVAIGSAGSKWNSSEERAVAGAAARG